MAVDVVTLTDRLRAELIPPPLGHPPGTCRVCCDAAQPPGLCEKCVDAERILGRPPVPVVPITLYARPSPMRERLTRYKDPIEPGDARFALEVAAITERWFAEHRRELMSRYGDTEASVVVPPTERPTPKHPFVAALEALPAGSVPPRVDVLAKGPGTVDRRRPVRDAFVADPSVVGRSFVLLDDVYTTGATSQSAAHALRVAGGHVPSPKAAETSPRISTTRRTYLAATSKRGLAMAASCGMPSIANSTSSKRRTRFASGSGSSNQVGQMRMSWHWPTGTCGRRTNSPTERLTSIRFMTGGQVRQFLHRPVGTICTASRRTSSGTWFSSTMAILPM